MDIFLIILAIVFAIISIIGSVVPALPGPILAYASLLIARWSGLTDFSNTFLIVMAIITAVIFTLDYTLPPLITRKFGGSKYASNGSMVGMVLGMIFTPIGMILGMLLGAFVGELVFAKKDGQSSLKAAMGSFVGFLVGTGIKLILCGYSLYVIIFSLF